MACVILFFCLKRPFSCHSQAGPVHLFLLKIFNFRPSIGVLIKYCVDGFSIMIVWYLLYVL